VLSDELGPVANRTTVILPWGSLLRAVALPEIASLGHIARLCLPNATVEIVFSYDQQDACEAASLGPARFDKQYVAALQQPYAQAGLEIIAVESIPQKQLVNYETTWASRLAFGRRREVWRIRASRRDRGADRP
jgi:16S rRNA (adenine(1408)-N(1))-methyltransferase